ncbi:MAG: hypothetical protein ABR915_10420 [Thermoguttaceae bacterium]|jgi:hypothetical protein
MNRSDDKRRTFRSPVHAPRERAVLKVGSTELPVVLLNESAGGLAVLTTDPGKLWVEQVGMLKTKTIWFEVRVKYILRYEPEDDDGRAAEDVEFRIGLHRLRELPQPGEATVRSWRSRVLGFLLPRERSGAFTGLSLTVLSVALVILSLVFVTLTWSRIRPHVTSVLRGSTADAGPDAGQDAVALPPTALRDLARRLPGAEVFLVPEVADILKLTDQQEAGLRRLHETTRQALDDVQRRWPDSSRQENAKRRVMIQDAARREALLLVSDQQRKRWEQLAQ